MEIKGDIKTVHFLGQTENEIFVFFKVSKPLPPPDKKLLRV